LFKRWITLSSGSGTVKSNLVQGIGVQGKIDLAKKKVREKLNL